MKILQFTYLIFIANLIFSKEILKFNEFNKFKILQITDIHYGENDEKD